MTNIPRTLINNILLKSGNPYATLVNKKAQTFLNLQKSNLNNNNKRKYGPNWLNLGNSSPGTQNRAAKDLFKKYLKVPSFLLKYINKPKTASKKRKWGSLKIHV